MEKKDRVKTSVRMFKAAAEVGSRLRQMRAVLDLSQSSAASELFISRERLANYEDGRTPLKTEVALEACRRFIFSEKWLATGEGDPRMSKNLRDDPVAKLVQPGTFFGAAYTAILSTRYEELATEFPLQIRFSRLGQSIFYDRHVMQEFIATWSFLLSSEKMEKLMHELIALGDRFCSDNVLPEHYPQITTNFQADAAGAEFSAFVNPAIKKRAFANRVSEKRKRA